MKAKGKLAATISKYQNLRGIPTEELAAAMNICVATYYNRQIDDNWRIEDLRRAKRKLSIPDGELTI